MNQQRDETAQVRVAGFSWVLQRTRNLRRLRRLRKSQDIDGLVQALDSGMGALSRSDAADYLGELGARDATQALIRHLQRDELLVRTSAARALGKIRYPSAVPALVHGLRDPEPLVRACAIAALGEIGDSAVIPSLTPFLRDRNSWLGGRAVYALSLIEDPGAQAAAREQLSRESQHERRLIMKALRKRERYLRSQGEQPRSG